MALEVTRATGQLSTPHFPQSELSWPCGDGKGGVCVSYVLADADTDVCVDTFVFVHFVLCTHSVVCACVYTSCTCVHISYVYNILPCVHVLCVYTFSMCMYAFLSVHVVLCTHSVGCAFVYMFCVCCC